MEKDIGYHRQLNGLPPLLFIDGYNVLIGYNIDEYRFMFKTESDNYISIYALVLQNSGICFILIHLYSYTV